MVPLKTGFSVLLGLVLCCSAFGQLPSSPTAREIWNSNNLVPAPAYDRFTHQSFQYWLSHQPDLATTIGSLSGMSPAEACHGFKNVRQCLLSAHLSRILNLDFKCLKSDVTRRASNDTGCPAGTGESHMSLTASVQNLKPQANAKAAIKLAKREVNADELRFGYGVLDTGTR